MNEIYGIDISMLLESDKIVIQMIIDGEQTLGRELTIEAIKDYVNMCIDEYCNLN